MSELIVIPARLNSTRLPRKPLLEKNGRPLIWHVYQQVKDFTTTIATEDQEIKDVCNQLGLNCVLTPKFENGTERVKWVAKNYISPPINKVINHQGDLIGTTKKTIQTVLAHLESSEIVSLYYKEKPKSLSNGWDLSGRGDLIIEPNKVKVAISDGLGLYFSRANIPYGAAEFNIHAGLYGFQTKVLLNLENKPGPLDVEGLEQLKWLRRHSIRMLETKPLLNIDTKEDYERWLKN